VNYFLTIGFAAGATGAAGFATGAATTGFATGAATGAATTGFGAATGAATTGLATTGAATTGFAAATGAAGATGFLNSIWVLLSLRFLVHLSGSDKIEVMIKPVFKRKTRILMVCGLYPLRYHTITFIIKSNLRICKWHSAVFGGISTKHVSRFQSTRWIKRGMTAKNEKQR
jgi:hypothetical protein